MNINVVGTSGSGKSTLINETLQPILSQHFYRSLKKPMPYESIEGIENIDKVHNADFSVIVYNFLDILSHARTETQIIRDLAEVEAAFRSL